MEISVVDRQEWIDRFISRMGEARTTFRYFDKRPRECWKRHVVTLIGCEDGEPVAYGHLDKEGDITWLGICVIPEAQGKGYGGLMIDRLLSCHDGVIWLAVDIGNDRAARLYERKGFRRMYEKEGRAYYRRGDP